MSSTRIQASSSDEQSIVIVDDSPDNLRLLVEILHEQGYKVRPAPNGERALATIHKNPPDLILLDIMMPGKNGYDVCQELKAEPKTADIPVIFLSALNDVFDKVKAFQAGGVDYITKPFQSEEVLVRVHTHLKLREQQKILKIQNERLKKKKRLIEEQARQLEVMATKDHLTGLSNRSDFLKKSAQEEHRFNRTGRPFSVLLLDIDHFKKVNDTYGHDCGDRVLIAVSRSLEKALRSEDILARWGGEEFTCLLPETGTKGALAAGEKIRAVVEGSAHNCEGADISVTVTLGACVYDGSISVEECIRRADAALYKGKHQGRNQIVISEQ